MSLLSSLLLLLIFSRLLGEAANRLHQPPILGEILAGVILGPSILNFIAPNEALKAISDLAIFLIVLSAGLEMDFHEVTQIFRGKGLMVALLGFIVPFISGISFGYLYGLDSMRSIFIGLCISITALPVTILVLEKFKLLKSHIAHYSVAAAILNDVIAMLILGVILNLSVESKFSAVALHILFSCIKLILFIGIILIINWILRSIHFERKIKKITNQFLKLFGDEGLFGLAIIFVLIFGTFAEMLGFHFIIGAFFGGLLLSKDLFKSNLFSKLQNNFNVVTSGFLTPIFFAYIGLEFTLASLTNIIFIIALIIIAVTSKLIAGWLGGLLAGLSTIKSAGIGIILNARGIIELVVASIAYQHNYIDQELFSTLIVLGIVTTMLTPVMFKKFIFPKLKK